MSWGPGQRIYHDALIGYTDGISTFYNESPSPTSNPFGPGGRYRPQSIVGNTGQLGQLLYDLTGDTVIRSDPQKQCQVWALKEPDPKEWILELALCPCTRAQALDNVAFGPETLPLKNATYVQNLRGLRWGGTASQVFQSILFNKQNAGKRCVYDPQGSLLAGYSERYFTSDKIQEHVGKTATACFPLYISYFIILLFYYKYKKRLLKSKYAINYFSSHRIFLWKVA